MKFGIHSDKLTISMFYQLKVDLTLCSSEINEQFHVFKVRNN